MMDHSAPIMNHLYYPNEQHLPVVEIPSSFEYTLDNEHAIQLSNMLRGKYGEHYTPKVVADAWKFAAKATTSARGAMGTHERAHILQGCTFKLNITDTSCSIFEEGSIKNIISSFFSNYPGITPDHLLEQLICMWSLMTVHRTSNKKSQGIDLVDIFLTTLCQQLHLKRENIKFADTTGQLPILRNLGKNLDSKKRSFPFGNSSGDWFGLFSLVTGISKRTLEERFGNFRICKSSPKSSLLSQNNEEAFRMRLPGFNNLFIQVVVKRGSLISLQGVMEGTALMKRMGLTMWACSSHGFRHGQGELRFVFT